MIGIVGICIVFVMVFGGYTMAGGKIGIILHSLPFEMMIILGAALGAFIIGNDKHGIGRTLMDRLVETVDLGAHDPLVMIGDPEYYGRFWGFTADATGHWQVPGPVERHRLLTRQGVDAILPVAGMLGPREGNAVVEPLHAEAGRG